MDGGRRHCKQMSLLINESPAKWRTLCLREQINFAVGDDQKQRLMYTSIRRTFSSNDRSPTAFVSELGWGWYSSGRLVKQGQWERSRVKRKLESESKRPHASEGNITHGNILRLYIRKILLYKPSAFLAFLNTLTMGTAFPRVPLEMTPGVQYTSGLHYRNRSKTTDEATTRCLKNRIPNTCWWLNFIKTSRLLITNC